MEKKSNKWFSYSSKLNRIKYQQFDVKLVIKFKGDLWIIHSNYVLISHKYSSKQPKVKSRVNT